MPAETTEAPEFSLTDTGNAERLLHRHGSNLRFCPRWKQWVCWNGDRWELDESGRVDRMVKEALRDMKRTASEMGEGNRLAPMFFNHAHKCEANRRIKDTIERMAKEPGVFVARISTPSPATPCWSTSPRPR